MHIYRNQDKIWMNEFLIHFVLYKYLNLKTKPKKYLVYCRNLWEIIKLTYFNIFTSTYLIYYLLLWTLTTELHLKFYKNLNLRYEVHFVNFEVYSVEYNNETLIPRKSDKLPLNTVIYTIDTLSYYMV